MTFERFDLDALLRLARVDLDSEEAEKLRSDLDRLLVYLRRLESLVANDEAEISADSGENGISLREDRVEEGALHEEVARRAPETRDGWFVLPPSIPSSLHPPGSLPSQREETDAS